MKRLVPIRSLPRRVWRRVQMQTPVQRVLGSLMGRTLTPDRWIFIVGCYNSGSTLLNEMLSQHPDIEGLPLEGVDLTDALPRPEDYGWVRMWCRCLDRVRLEPGPGMAERAERIQRQWSLWFPGDMPNLVEKSIANASRMPFLQEYLQPAYFIYIVRNGYAVAEGIRRRSNPQRWRNPVYQSHYPIELCAEQWQATDKLVQHDRSQLDRFLQIFYEDLTESPHLVTKVVTDFLGISDFEPYTVESRWNIGERESEIVNMNHKHVAKLTCQECQRIEKVAGATLSRYGYLSSGDP